MSLPDWIYPDLEIHKEMLAQEYGWINLGKYVGDKVEALDFLRCLTSEIMEMLVRWSGC